MFEVFIGAILGTIGSLAVSYFYYKVSAKDLEKTVFDLKKEIQQLQEVFSII